MKKLLLITLLIMSIIIPTSAFANNEDRWKYAVHEEKNNNITCVAAIDSTSIVVSGENINFWVRRTHSNEQEIYGHWYSWDIANWEYNMSTKSFRFGNEIYYNDSGKVVYSGSSTFSRWVRVVPASLGEAVIKSLLRILSEQNRINIPAENL